MCDGQCATDDVRRRMCDGRCTTKDVRQRMYDRRCTTYNTRTLPTDGASKKGTNEKETKWKKGDIANETWLALGGGIMGVGIMGVGAMGVGVMGNGYWVIVDGYI